MHITEEKRYERLRYLLSAHEGCRDPEGKYPVLLYLHGAGSRGNDLNVIRESSFFRFAFQFDVPMRIYAPQCGVDTWFDVFEQLIGFAENVYEDSLTDRTRFYLAGVSMGGYAAWQLAMSRPALFAALTPVCGGGMAWNAPRLRTARSGLITACWIRPSCRRKASVWSMPSTPPGDTRSL